MKALGPQEKRTAGPAPAQQPGSGFKHKLLKISDKVAFSFAFKSLWQSGLQVLINPFRAVSPPPHHCSANLSEIDIFLSET